MDHNYNRPSMHRCMFYDEQDTTSKLFNKLDKKYSFLKEVDERGGEGEKGGDHKPDESKGTEAPVEPQGNFRSVGSDYICGKAHEYFSMCICGPSLSGKTTLLLDILSRFVEEKRYEEYVIISPTAKATKFFDEYLNDKTNIVGEYDELFIQELLDRQSDAPKKSRKSVCLVIDDCIGSSSSMQRSKTFADLWALARNMHMTVIMLSQAVNRQFLPKIARCNCHMLACCGLRGKSCIETLRTDYLDGYGDGVQGIQLYKDITRGPYNFCLFNLRDPHAVELTDWVMRVRARPKVPVFKMKNTYAQGSGFAKADKEKKKGSTKDTTVDDVCGTQKALGWW